MTNEQLIERLNNWGQMLQSEGRWERSDDEVLEEIVARIQTAGGPPDLYTGPVPDQFDQLAPCWADVVNKPPQHRLVQLGSFVKCIDCNQGFPLSMLNP